MRAGVDEEVDVVVAEELDETIGFVIGVADGEEGWGHADRGEL